MEALMKIGEFSRKYDLPLDTVRHYMAIGIITPIKRGGHYHFGLHTEEQSTAIKKLKQLGFKLGEIRKILLYKIFTQFDYENEKEFHYGLMANKYQEVKIEIDKLNHIQSNLENEMKRLHTLKINRLVYGLPLSVLDLLQCPR